MTDWLQPSMPESVGHLATVAGDPGCTYPYALPHSYGKDGSDRGLDDCRARRSG
jgi:hypothetical protein